MMMGCGALSWGTGLAADSDLEVEQDGCGLSSESPSSSTMILSAIQAGATAMKETPSVSDCHHIQRDRVSVYHRHTEHKNRQVQQNGPADMNGLSTKTETNKPGF